MLPGSLQHVSRRQNDGIDTSAGNATGTFSGNISIHDLYLCETALLFENNWAGPHSIRNNVIANNRLRDMVSWHPEGGSALTIRKPTQMMVDTGAGNRSTGGAGSRSVSGSSAGGAEYWLRSAGYIEEVCLIHGKKNCAHQGALGKVAKRSTGAQVMQRSVTPYLPVTLDVEHNTIYNNSGQGPYGVTGHAIAWTLNGAAELTVNIANNLASKNQGLAMIARNDTVYNFGHEPSGGFDWNDCTEEIDIPFGGYPVGSNNIGAAPVFTSDPDAHGKYLYRLADNCPARNGGSDARDMGAILNDPTGPLEENFKVALTLGASKNLNDNLVDVGTNLPASLRIEALNPWGSNPPTVRVYLAAVNTGLGRVEIRDASGVSVLSYLDVALLAGGTGTAAFSVRGITASNPANDVAIQATVSQGVASVMSEEALTVQTPGSYQLITATFNVRDGQGQLLGNEALVEVPGFGTVSSGGTLQIKANTAISYRVLADYGAFSGNKRVGGAAMQGVVTASNNVFEGVLGRVRLRGRDQLNREVPGAWIQVADDSGRTSPWSPAASELLLPLPGTYKAIGRVGQVLSSGAGVSPVALSLSSTEIVAPFRRLDIVARDQGAQAYTDVFFELRRGDLLAWGAAGSVILLPVGGTVDLHTSRFGMRGDAQECLIGASQTELTGNLYNVSVSVKNQATGLDVPNAAWRLLVAGFEQAYGTAGTAGTRIALPKGAQPDIEGFFWNASYRTTITVDPAALNISGSIDLTKVAPLQISPPAANGFSPTFLEGERDPSVNSVTLTSIGGTPATATAKLLGNDTWYAYLALDQSVPVTVRVTAGNKYGQTATLDFAGLNWSQTFVGPSSDQVIPQNSALLLTTDASGVAGAAQIEIVPGDGQAATRVGLGAAVKVTYPTPGAYAAQANILDAQGQVLASRSINVTSVRVASSTKNFACALEFTREIAWDVYPAQARSSAQVAPTDATLLKVNNLRNSTSTTTQPNRLLANIRPYKPSGPRGSAVDGGAASYGSLTARMKSKLLSQTAAGYELRMGGSGWIPENTPGNVDRFSIQQISGSALTISGRDQITAMGATVLREGNMGGLMPFGATMLGNSRGPIGMGSISLGNQQGPVNLGGPTVTNTQAGGLVGGVAHQMTPPVPGLTMNMQMMGGSGTTFENGSGSISMSTDSLGAEGISEVGVQGSGSTPGSGCLSIDCAQPTEMGTAPAYSSGLLNEGTRFNKDDLLKCCCDTASEGVTCSGSDEPCTDSYPTPEAMKLHGHDQAGAAAGDGQGLNDQAKVNPSSMAATSPPTSVLGSLSSSFANKQARVSKTMPQGWNLNYEQTLTRYGPLAVALRTESGAQVVFERDSRTDTTYKSDVGKGMHSTLEIRTTDPATGQPLGRETFVLKGQTKTAFLVFDGDTGLLEQKIDLNGNRTKVFYGPKGELTQVRDPFDSTVTIAKVGGAVTVTSPGGRTTVHSKSGISGSPNGDRTYEYDDNGLLYKTDGWAYTMDANGTIQKITRPSSGLGEPTETTYSFSKVGGKWIHTETGWEGVKKMTIDPAFGVWTKMERDRNAVGDGLIVTERFFDQDRNLLREVDAEGVATEYTYDSEGRVLTQRIGSHAPTIYTYDNLGLLVTEKDPNGNTTTYNRDGATGQIMSIDLPDGGTVLFERNARGQITKKTDPRGAVTQYTYGGNGYLASITVTSDDPADRLPGGQSYVGVKTFKHDDDGWLLEETDFEGRIYRHTYDSHGNRIETRGPLSPLGADLEETLVDKTTYDAHNHVTSARPSGGGEWTYEYDALHRIRRANKPSANGTGLVRDYEVMARDARGNATVVKDTDGNDWVSSFNVAGQVEEKISPLGAAFKTSYTYHTVLGRDITVTDARQHGTRVKREDRWLVQTVTDAKGKPTQHAYDENGNLLSRTDRDLKSRGFEYTGRDLVKKARNGDGGVIESFYDTESNLVRSTAPNNLEVTNRYSKLSRRVAVAITEGTGPVDQTRLRDFTKNGSPTKSDFAVFNGGAAPNYSTATLSYNAREQRTAKSLPLGINDSIDYDAHALPKTYRDGRGFPWTTLRDVFGRTVSDTDGEGYSTSRTYNDQGLLKVSTDRAGNQTRFDYDIAYRLIKTTFADGTYEMYQLDLVGNVEVAELFEADGQSVQKTLFTYDELDRMLTKKILLKDGSGQYTNSGPSWSYEYYNEGYLKKVTDPNLLATSFEYDGEWRTTKVTKPDGASLEYGFDTAGNLRTFKDENQKLTSYDYNHRGQLTKKTDPLMRTVEYVYDQAGILLSRTVNGKAEKTTTYAYDILNRRIEETLPVGQGPGGAPAVTVRRWTYDAAHNIATYVDGRGVLCTYTARDGVGRVLQKVFTVPPALAGDVPDVPPVGFAWTENGQLKAVSGGNGGASYSYDSRNRLKAESVGAGPSSTFGYDARSLVKSVTVGSYSNLNVTHGYDSAGRRLTTAQDGLTTSFEWDAGYRRKKVSLPNGTSQEYTFDNASRITNIAYKKNGTAFENYNYNLDPAGNVLGIATQNSGYSYTYDDGYQLLSESRSGVQSYAKSYTYDTEGNRLTKTEGLTTRTYSYNSADQLTSWSEPVSGSGTKTCLYSYDLEGNVTGKSLTEGAGESDAWEFKYDAVNRMQRAKQTANGGGPGALQELVNTYVGDGWERIESTNKGTDGVARTMRYGWSGGALLAEFSSGGALTASYLNDGLDAPLYKTAYSGGGAAVAGRTFYHQDANGRVHHVTDGNGDVAEKYVYDAFGTQTILDPANAVIGQSAIGNRIGFQGREQEGLSGGSQMGGLVYLRNRFLEPEAGRFLNRNPWGMIHKTPSLYDFVSNNPMAFSEPFSTEVGNGNPKPKPQPGPGRFSGLSKEEMSRVKEAWRKRADQQRKELAEQNTTTGFLGELWECYKKSVQEQTDSSAKMWRDANKSGGLDWGAQPGSNVDTLRKMGLNDAADATQALSGTAAVAGVAAAGTLGAEVALKKGLYEGAKLGLCVLNAGTNLGAGSTNLVSPAGSTGFGTKAVAAGLAGLAGAAMMAAEAQSGTGDAPKDVEISKTKYPETAQHIEDAQAAGHPSELTIDRPGATERRSEALAGHEKVCGKQLDEYPPAMFKEGGEGASVRPVDPADNMGAGASMGNQLRGVPEGARVRIKVTD